jgi:hypothetical protein
VAFVVEKTDPHAVNPHLTGARYGAETATEAGRLMEDLCPVEAQDITECLWRGQAILHVDDETGVEYSARRVDPEAPHAVRLRITINGVRDFRHQLRRVSVALNPWLRPTELTWAFPSWSPAWRPFDWSVDS